MSRVAWVALSLCRNIGGKTLRSLSEYFDGDLHAILQADEKELIKVPQVGKVIAKQITEIDLSTTEQWLEKWQQENIQVITRRDPLYPKPFLTLADEPPIIFVRGEIHQALWKSAVAIVGTRNPGKLAQEFAMQTSEKLAQQGVTIVSGLALGIDTYAHQGTLEYGKTVAVLGNGVQTIYPPENQTLAENILDKGGILMSEVAPHVPPSKTGLVARNRLISGLCGSVIIVETARDGGAMHAARRAEKQGKKVFALDISASGNQELLQNGATRLSIQEDYANFLTSS